MKPFSLENQVSAKGDWQGKVFWKLVGVGLKSWVGRNKVSKDRHSLIASEIKEKGKVWIESEKL